MPYLLVRSEMDEYAPSEAGLDSKGLFGTEADEDRSRHL